MLRKKVNFEDERQRARLIAIGLLAFGIAVLLAHLTVGIGWVGFLSGVLTGFSLVLNSTTLYYYGKARRQIRQMEEAGRTAKVI